MTLQDTDQAQANHARFVERVRASRQVWGLRSREGWANCPSNDVDGVDVLVFWSDRAYAARHAKQEWSEYVATPIDLGDFLDKWIPGMDRDGTRVGTNWDAHLCGLEMEPKTLGEQLTAPTP